VAYIIEKNETLERELESLNMVHDNWQKYLITMETYTHNEKIE
jgi:hypothetical protein